MCQIWSDLQCLMLLHSTISNSTTLTRTMNYHQKKTRASLNLRSTWRQCQRQVLMVSEVTREAVQLMSALRWRATIRKRPLNSNSSISFNSSNSRWPRRIMSLKAVASRISNIYSCSNSNSLRWTSASNIPSQDKHPQISMSRGQQVEAHSSSKWTRPQTIWLARS